MWWATHLKGNKCMNEWMNESMNQSMNIHACMHGLMDGRKEGWMAVRLGHKRIYASKDICTHAHTCMYVIMCWKVNYFSLKKRSCIVMWTKVLLWECHSKRRQCPCRTAVWVLDCKKFPPIATHRKIKTVNVNYCVGISYLFHAGLFMSMMQPSDMSKHDW